MPPFRAFGSRRAVSSLGEQLSVAHRTGRERMCSPTLQTLQDPILLLPWVCFEGSSGGFPNPNPEVRAFVESSRASPPHRPREDVLAHSHTGRADALPETRPLSARSPSAVSAVEVARWRMRRGRSRRAAPAPSRRRLRGRGRRVGAHLR
jgi:hypothetical protein